ncbi:MFS transporter (plasmid) [Streptomyces sp. NBC_00015]|uniref:MFS transporter n=1 Tax=Streptomyces sp. NBC_00015 TaxID=2903611 RepID=UPI002F9173DE
MSLKGHRSFTAYLSGEASSLLGTSAHAVALPTLAVLELHAGPDQIAALAVFAQLPTFLLALPAGAVVDRHAKKRLLVGTDLVAAVVVATIPAAAAAGQLSVTLLYGVALTLGASNVIHQAAAIAIVPQLVALDDLAAANSRVGAAFSAADTLGTYAGTAIVALLGAARAFLLDAASYLVSAWCASRIRPIPFPLRNVPKRRRMTGEIVEGLSYVARTPLVRPLVLSLALTGVGSGMIQTFWAYRMLTTLHAGPVGLGVVMGASGIGGLAGAINAPRIVRRWGPGRVLVCAFVICPSMSVPLLLASPGIDWLAVLAVAGAVQMASAACAGTTQRSLRQQICPPELQGRAQQTSTWLVSGSRPFASAAAGALASWGSVSAALYVGTLVLFVPVAVLWYSPVRRLTTMPRAPEPAPSPTAC